MFPIKNGQISLCRNDDDDFAKSVYQQRTKSNGTTKERTYKLHEQVLNRMRTNSNQKKNSHAFYFLQIVVLDCAVCVWLYAFILLHYVCIS